MTQDADEFNKAKATKSKPAVSLAIGVTGSTYVDYAKAFIAKSGGAGHMICQRSALTRGDQKPIEANLRTWGAWMAYFEKIGRPRVTRRLIAKQDYQMVPAEWPHLFDAEASVVADHLAADAFVAERSRENNLQFDTKRAILNPRSLNIPRQNASPYQPFPRLWEAFADNLRILDDRNFATLTEASRLLAMQGKAVSETYLNARGADGWTAHRQRDAAVAPPPPPQSSADLKTEARFASPEFLAALKAQGYKLPEKPRKHSEPYDPGNGFDL